MKIPHSPPLLICSECNTTMIIHQYDESAVGLEGTWEGREVPELINSDFLMRLIYQYIKRDLGAKKDNKSGAYGYF